MKVAILQFAPLLGAVEDNIKRADQLLEAAETEGRLEDVQLLAGPEMAFTGEFSLILATHESLPGRAVKTKEPYYMMQPCTVTSKPPVLSIKRYGILLRLLQKSIYHFFATNSQSLGCKSEPQTSTHISY